MFWGLVVEPGKRYEQVVDKAFHISKAVLEVNPKDNELISVQVEYDGQEYIACNLQRDKILQTSLDLHFKVGDNIGFYHSGKSNVHLTGYLTEDNDVELSSDDDDDDEDEDELIGDRPPNNLKLTPVPKRKELTEETTPKPKKAKLVTKLEENEEDDSDEDDEDYEIDDSDLEEEEEEEEVEEPDSVEDDSESEVDVATPATPATPATSAKGKKVNAAQGKEIQNQQKVQQGKGQQGKGQPEKIETPESKKKKKKQQQQQQLTPSAEQNGTPGKKLKIFQGTPKEGGKPESQKGTPASQEPSKKTLQGGVVIEDLKTGSGPVAKPGKQVTVYYTGCLKQNNKQFDATQHGPGFKFMLGRNEVIKGWDIGVSGMRVGGKRKIICPPHVAYGKRGQPPTIPANSTLVFEVDLKSVN